MSPSAYFDDFELSLLQSLPVPSLSDDQAARLAALQREHDDRRVAELNAPASREQAVLDAEVDLAWIMGTGADQDAAMDRLLRAVESWEKEPER